MGGHRSPERRPRHHDFHERLAAALNDCKASVVLSGYDSTEGRRGSCCPGRCYCGHDTCHAFASWTPRPVLNVTDISKPKGKKGSAWAEREESTWIDKL